MKISLDSLVDAFDPAAIACIQSLAAAGSINPKIYTHDGYRICCSLDPSGDHGELEWHVSVSRNERPVPTSIASSYGRALVPFVDGWDNIGQTEIATHLWAKM